MITTTNEEYLPKLGIGTVQFGLDYGISNAMGQTSLEEVRAILKCAQDHHVKMLDTARLYGNSEESIGRAVRGTGSFDIVTKTIPIKKEFITHSDVMNVTKGFEASLRSLGVRRVYGLLLHHADDLLASNGNLLYEYLLSLKDEGLVKKIGVSIYHQKQIEVILNDYDIDLIQLPCNIFDQRLVASGLLKTLKSKDIEIHCRSAFMQGLIFMSPSDLPQSLSDFAGSLKAYQEWVKDEGLSPIEGALSYVMSQKEIDKVICGVNNKEQLDELVVYAKSLPVFPEDSFSSFAVHNDFILNPSNW